MIKKYSQKTRTFLIKLLLRINKKTYLSYTHLENKRLYEDNEYCLNILKDQIQRPIIFQSYWYGKIERKQLFSIKSVLVTQPNASVWLWIDEQTWDDNIEVIQKLNKFDQMKTIKYCPLKELKGTPFENLSTSHFTQSNNLPFRADAFRILALYKYGGIYFDLDIMFLREIRSFINWDFIYCWENQPYGNNAIIHLQNNETKKQLFNIVQKTNSFQPWIIFNYANKLRNILTLPTAYFDPLWLLHTRQNNTVTKHNYIYPVKNWDEFFTKGIKEDVNYKNFFEGCYAFHWHNRWKLEVTKNSYFDQFDKQFSDILSCDI